MQTNYPYFAKDKISTNRPKPLSNTTHTNRTYITPYKSNALEA